MRLVKRQKPNQEFDLPAGLYEVRAVLDDGLSHSAVVKVKGDETTRLQLGHNEDVAAHRGKRWKERLSEIELIRVKGARRRQASDTTWEFIGEGDYNSVPSAVFLVQGLPQSISLPVNPINRGRSNACHVRLEGQPNRPQQLQAWISPSRAKANAMQNMFTGGHFMEAADLADEPVELLRAKFKDAAAAALGALVLYRTGRLHKWTGWTRNLAEQFEWLPDGAVLLALLLQERKQDPDLALKLALEASRRRPLFTETFSLLLDLLRRWPNDDGADQRQMALAMMAEKAPYVDWKSTYFSHLGTAEDDR